MKTAPKSIEEYLEQLPEDRQEPIRKLRDTILGNLPSGFSEEIYGMIGYVIPHSIYPAGYHCDTSKPLPFISVASQKNFVALYHMGIYAKPELSEWFTTEYPKHCKTKLDMGKSCIRFKKMEQIPYELIGELVKKITSEEWISIYEETIKK
ncbi:MAG: hypothetical protein ACI85I_001126 [Arenicella sp.]|jgi:hypothetical protein